MFGSPTYFGTGAQSQPLWISSRIVCSVSDIVQTEELTKQTMDIRCRQVDILRAICEEEKSLFLGIFSGEADVPAAYLKLRSDKTPQPLILLCHLHFYINSDNFLLILINISLKTSYLNFRRDSLKGDIGLQREQG